MAKKVTGLASLRHNARILRLAKFLSNSNDARSVAIVGR